MFRMEEYLLNMFGKSIHSYDFLRLSCLKSRTSFHVIAYSCTGSTGMVVCFRVVHFLVTLFLGTEPHSNQHNKTKARPNLHSWMGLTRLTRYTRLFLVILLLPPWAEVVLQYRNTRGKNDTFTSLSLP